MGVGGSSRHPDYEANKHESCAIMRKVRIEILTCLSDQFWNIASDASWRHFVLFSIIYAELRHVSWPMTLTKQLLWTVVSGKSSGCMGDTSITGEEESVKQLGTRPLNSVYRGKAWHSPCIETRHMKKVVNSGSSLTPRIIFTKHEISKKLFRWKWNFTSHVHPFQLECLSQPARFQTHNQISVSD